MSITAREKQILSILRKTPLIPQQQLASEIGCSRSAVAGHIMNLTRKGHIQGKGYILPPEKYAVVIGGANMDLLGRSMSDLVHGDSNPGTLTTSAGGVGRNIAENLARLGSQVEFIGAIGGDIWAEQIKSHSIDAGVGMSHCLTLPNESTSCYLSIHSPDGEMYVALNDMSLIDSLTADRLSKRAGIINRSNAVIVDANLSDDALSYVFSNVDEQPIFVDPVSTIKARKLLPYLSHIHTIKPNIAEAEVLAGIKYRSLDDLPKLADILHKRGIQRLLISLGADGAFASTPEEHTLIPAVKVRVNNVTGAGDALMAGLVHSHINNLSWHEGIEFALAASRVALSANNTINNKMSEHAVYTVLQETQPC